MHRSARSQRSEREAQSEPQRARRPHGARCAAPRAASSPGCRTARSGRGEREPVRARSATQAGHTSRERERHRPQPRRPSGTRRTAAWACCAGASDVGHAAQECADGVRPSAARPLRRPHHPLRQQRVGAGRQQVRPAVAGLARRVAAAADQCTRALLPRRTRRSWKPNAVRKRVFSELLGRMLPLNLTTHTLRCIDKAGGAGTAQRTGP